MNNLFFLRVFNFFELEVDIIIFVGLVGEIFFFVFIFLRDEIIFFMYLKDFLILIFIKLLFVIGYCCSIIVFLFIFIFC